MTIQVYEFKKKKGELANRGAMAYPCLYISGGIYVYVNLPI